MTAHGRKVRDLVAAHRARGSVAAVEGPSPATRRRPGPHSLWARCATVHPTTDRWGWICDQPRCGAAADGLTSERAGRADLAAHFAAAHPPRVPTVEEALVDPDLSDGEA